MRFSVEELWRHRWAQLVDIPCRRVSAEACLKVREVETVGASATARIFLFDPQSSNLGQGHSNEKCIRSPSTRVPKAGTSTFNREGCLVIVPNGSKSGAVGGTAQTRGKCGRRSNACLNITPKDDCIRIVQLLQRCHDNHRSGCEVRQATGSCT